MYMTKFYLVDQDITVRNEQGFLNLTKKQLDNCIDEKKKSFVVFTSKEDALRVARDGVKNDDKDQFPIFEIEYQGKGRKTSFDLDDEEETLEARIVPADKITILSASLEHVSDHFKPVSFEVDSDDEAFDQEEKIQPIAVVKQTSSRTQRLLAGTGSVLSTLASYLPRPSILIGGATGAGTYYFDGANQVAPALMDSFRQSLPTGIPALAVDATVAIGTGLVAAGLTEAVQRAPKPSLHFGFGRKNTATINSSATATHEADTKPKCPVRFG
jgi:hypothetical protein